MIYLWAGVPDALDAVGVIPFLNTIVKGAQYVAALGSAGWNIFGNGGVAEAGFSGASLSLSTVDEAHVMTVGTTAAELVPYVGIGVSAFAVRNDFQEMGKNFDGCMAGD